MVPARHRSFNATAIVQPFELSAVGDSIQAGKAPVYRLSDVEARAEAGTASGAVAVRLQLNSGTTARVGECMLLQLHYSSTDSNGSVRTCVSHRLAQQRRARRCMYTCAMWISASMQGMVHGRKLL